MKYWWLIMVAGLLAGCGDKERVADLEKQLAAKEEKLQKADGQLRQAAFTRQDVALEKTMLSEIHEPANWASYEDRKKVLGYDLAKETIIGQNIIAARIRNHTGGDLKSDILAPLYWLEDRWPDRLSSAGVKISNGLWWCRDAVTNSRLAMEAISLSQIKDAESFNLAMKNSLLKCSLAMQGVKADS